MFIGRATSNARSTFTLWCRLGSCQSSATCSKITWKHEDYKDDVILSGIFRRGSTGKYRRHCPQTEPSKAPNGKHRRRENRGFVYEEDTPPQPIRGYESIVSSSSGDWGRDSVRNAFCRILMATVRSSLNIYADALSSSNSVFFGGQGRGLGRIAMCTLTFGQCGTTNPRHLDTWRLCCTADRQQLQQVELELEIENWTKFNPSLEYITSHFGEKSFQAIDCTVTDNQLTIAKRKRIMHTQKFTTRQTKLAVINKNMQKQKKTKANRHFRLTLNSKNCSCECVYDGA